MGEDLPVSVPWDESDLTDWFDFSDLLDAEASESVSELSAASALGLSPLEGSIG